MLAALHQQIETMDFIFMLTRQDRTVPNCLELLDAIAPLQLRHIGFKNVGADADTLRRLNRRIKDAGAVSYMEIVSKDRAACLHSARLAAEIGVDCLLGAADPEAVQAATAGHPIEYYPYPGLPVGHPARLGGTPELIAEHCRRFLAAGCPGVALLAYRATEAAPLDLIRAARTALGQARLIVAGNIDSPARIRAAATAGADAFTVGSAVFNGAFAAGQDGIQAQLQAVLDAAG
jgi:hypothetical protein